MFLTGEIKHDVWALWVRKSFFRCKLNFFVTPIFQLALENESPDRNECETALGSATEALS